MNIKNEIRSTIETVKLTRAKINTWKKPPFQRPLYSNAKLTSIVHLIKEWGVIPGVITIGVLDGEYYTVDGQHRLHGFMTLNIEAAFADVRIVHFNTMEEMANEFVALNSKIVAMRPDDNLRAIEMSTPTLRYIREHCDFVGYDHVRRQPASPILSMSLLLRAWTNSFHETPRHVSGQSAASIAEMMTMENTQRCVYFLGLAFKAWERDPEYRLLWSSLNLTITMWLFHRLVTTEKPKHKNHTLISEAEFVDCLNGLSASAEYCAWLRKRMMTDRERSPCFMRVKRIFLRRLQAARPGEKVQLPQPEWAASGGRVVGGMP